MKPTEKKKVCDLISLVANAIAEGTIPEAEDSLIDGDYDYLDNEIIEHTFNVLTTIFNKQEQKQYENY